jgi:hypothetical protein
MLGRQVFTCSHSPEIGHEAEEYSQHGLESLDIALHSLHLERLSVYVSIGILFQMQGRFEESDRLIAIRMHAWKLF